jgi:hypothetical protein
MTSLQSFVHDTEIIHPSLADRRAAVSGYLIELNDLSLALL